MTRNSLFAAAASLVVSSLVLVGCSSGIPDAELVPVTLSGKVSMAAGPLPSGKLHFRIYVLESLEGDLQHPLEEIVDFESDTPEFTHSFDYPAHMGEGLALHAWLDTDGDGVFCTPDARLDPSGLGLTTDTPEGDVTLNVMLTENCRAANWFYPRPE